MFVRRALLVIFGLFCAVSASAVTYTWNGGTAAWNLSTSWTPARAAAANTDVLVFNGGGSTTANSVPTETIGQIVVSNNTNVTLQAGAAGTTLTINGGTGTDLDVGAGSQLNVNTVNALTISLAAAATGSISGAMTFSQAAHVLKSGAAGAVTFQNGSTFTTGTGFSGSVFGTTAPLNAVVFASGSTYVHNAGSNPFGATAPSSVVVFQTGSLYKQQATAGLSFSGRTYANFEFNTGTVSVTGGSAVVLDNVTITTGTLNWGMTGTPGHAIKGNISIAAAGTLNFNPASAGTLNLGGAASQSITNAGTLTINSANQTININNASGITLGSNVTFQAGALTLTSGNISTGANTLIINSAASVSRPGTGHVIGNLRKDYAANGSKVFEVGTANGYSPFTANVTAGTPGNITCAAVQGAQPNMNAATSIARYWILTATAGITADLTFQYLAGDVNGNEAAYQVFRVSGGVPVNFPASVVNTGTHTATLAGVSTFSDWTVGEAGGPPPTPTLNVGDVSLSEGDPPGTTTFNFPVTLTSAAGAGGVSFTWQTADGTATLADNDYVQVTPTAGSISSGNTSTTISVTVNRDLTPEANETFFVNISGVTNANAGDTQGQGTINNDDVAITPIHTVQGDSSVTQTSPIVGSSVTIDGIVTGVKSNGFFVQEEDADADANPNTSEGVFVFTSSAPPAAAAFTARVRVTGTVAEFVPGSDPQQPPLTELSGSLTITQMAPAGQPLPTPVTLTPTNPDPAGPFNQMEKYEGMRVTTASMTVTGPSDGSVNESAATGTSNGRFHAVVTGVAKPFREPGIQAPDLPPTGSIPPIPRWDTNPENLRVESATINSQPVLTVRGNDVVGPIQGPLDYGFRGYAIYPDGTLAVNVTPGTLNTMVTTPLGTEFTVASFNLERFFDTTDDPESDAVLTAGAFANRLQKASIAIRNHLKFPDVVGVQEMEHLSTLQALATQINNDAVANAQPNPQYVAFLVEGNDVGGIDVGYLVKTAPVPGGAPRVAVNSVTQVGAATTYIDPTTGNPATLNDRPPLVLDATVNRAPGVSFNVIIINNHLRSLLNLTDPTVSGPTTVGDRVRRKRQIQADFLAQYIQGRLTTTPTEHIIVIGDMNNFEFNDGYQDSLDTIAGTPVPDNETVVCSTCPQAPNTGDGIDQLNPNLTNLVNTPPALERYSYNFDGNAQNIDHALVSPAVVTDTSARRIEHPRIDADYPETERNTNTTAFRISDHDPIVAFFAPLGFNSADLDITKADSPDPVTAGTNLTYTITVTNSGPDVAATSSWSDTIPAGTTFVSVSSVAGWTCSDPGVGNNGLVSCSNPAFAVGNAVFTLVVHVAPTVTAGTVLSNTASATSTTSDPDNADLSDTETTTVAASADLVITKTDNPDPVTAGNNLTYQLTLTNNGPSNAASATFSDTLPAGTTFVSLNTTGTWSCSDPGVGNNGVVSCTNTSFPVTADFFTLVVHVDPSTADGTVLSNTATIGSSTPDPNGGNENDTATTTVAASADISLTKSDSPDPVFAGQNLTYTITVGNAGPSNAASASWSDNLPAGTTFVSISSVPGWSCSDPGVGNNGTVSCSNASFAPTNGDVFTLVVNVASSTANGTVLSNTATVTSSTSDPNTGNESDTETTNVTGTGIVSGTKTWSGTRVQGSNITYTVTLTNGMFITQPDNGTDEFVDVLPASLILVSANASSGTAVANTGTNTVTWNGSIPAVTSAPNNTVTITIVATIDPSATCAVSNQGTINYDADGSDGSNESSGVTDDPTTAAPNDPTVFNIVQANEVTSTKAVSGTFIQGSNVTFTVVMTNHMTVTQPDNFGHEWTDILPAGLTLVSVNATSGTTGKVANIAFWDGSLAVNASVTITIVATISPTATGVICNQGQSIFDRDCDGQNESSHLTDDPSTVAVDDPTCFRVIQANEVTSTKAVSGTFIQGSNVTFTVVMTNHMTVTQPDNFGHEWTDIFPAGLTPVSVNATSGTAAICCGNSIVFWDGSLAPNASVTITIVATISPTATGNICNQGQSIFDRDGDGQNESSHLTDDPSTAAVDDPTCFRVIQANQVTSTKSVSGTFVPNSNVTYTVVVTNHMTVTQPDNFGHEWTDNLPAGLTAVSVNASSGTAAICCSNSIVFWDGSLAPNASVTITIVAKVSASATGTICNQGQSIFDRDGDGQNESSHLTDDPSTAAADDPTCFAVAVPGTLTASKTVSGPPYTTGSTVTYTVTLTNNLGFTQPNNPTDEFTDVLPAGVALVSANATSGTALANVGTNTVTWNGSIPNGTSVVITITATITATSGTVINQGTAHFDADNNGTNESNAGTGSGSSAFAVDAIANYPATKSVSTTGVQGAAVTYTVVLTNNLSHTQGDNPGNEFTDVLPTGVVLVSASATSGTAVANTGTNTVTWNGSIPAGGSVTITINGTVSPSATGVVSNQGTIAVDLDNNGTNETAGVTDNPTTAAPDDPTIFTAQPAVAAEAVPTLSEWMLFALAALLGLAALTKMRS